MEQVTVTFDRVFDVVRNVQRNRVLCTEFGFQFGGLRKCGVAVPGSPEIEEGITVTAILRKPENWQTLMGWVNHKTGEVVCKSPASEIGYVALVIVGWLWAYSLRALHPIVSALAVIVPASLFCYGVAKAYNCIRAKKMLTSKQIVLMATRHTEVSSG
jgi:hypothetical protein